MSSTDCTPGAEAAIVTRFFVAGTELLCCGVCPRELWWPSPFSGKWVAAPCAGVLPSTELILGLSFFLAEWNGPLSSPSWTGYLMRKPCMKRVTGNMKGINWSMDVLSPFDSPSRVKSFLATCNRAWQTEKDRLSQVTFSYPHSHSPTYAHTYTTKHAQPHTISSADYTTMCNCAWPCP